MHKRTVDEAQADEHNYRSLIGVLMFIAQAAYPIIQHCVNRCSQYLSDPSDKHMEVALGILAYLKSNSNYCILYTATDSPQAFDPSVPPPTMLHAYVDSDHATCPDTRKSVSGYLIYFGNCLIGWCTRLQDSPSGHGPSESEYKALYLSSSEIVYYRQLLTEIGITQNDANTIYEDNSACLQFAYGNTSGSKMKSIDIKLHAVKDWAA